ncbi:MAG: hypothetical protein HY335_10140 [Deinococcus sp.]|nr:hypothetical protein [Deinococcus sp.]
MMKRRLLLGLGLVIIALGAWSLGQTPSLSIPTETRLVPQPPPDPAAVALFAASLSAIPDHTGVRLSSNPVLGIAMTLRHVRAGPLLALDYQRPEPLRGRGLVTDGRHWWAVGVDTVPALLREVLMSQVGTDLDLVVQHYHLRLADEETVAGRPAAQLEFVQNNRVIERRWIDAETSLELRREQYDEGEELVTASGFIQLEYGVSNQDMVRLSHITATAPIAEGPAKFLSLAETSQAAGFALQPPAYLPAGFRLLGGLVPARGQAYLIYTDGLRQLVLYQEPVPWYARWLPRAMQPATGTSLGRAETLITRRQVGGLNCAVICSLLVGERRRIAESIGTLRP